MKYKKSQAMMEFLTTYGFAILVVLVAIGALTYFGAFPGMNPEAMFCRNNQDNCTCDEYNKYFDCNSIMKHCTEKGLVAGEYYDCVMEKGCKEIKECKQIRKKTICESNPNDKENCVCEEYGPGNIPAPIHFACIKDNRINKTCVNDRINKFENKGYTIEYDNFGNSYVLMGCKKAHNKTDKERCEEKGYNWVPKYILTDYKDKTHCKKEIGICLNFSLRGD